MNLRTHTRYTYLLPYFLALLFISSAEARQHDLLRSWVFQGKTEQAMRDKLQEELELQIEQVHKICHLDEDQQTKLRDAATADIHRFFRDVNQVKRDLGLLKINEQNHQEAWMIVSPLHTRMQGGFFRKQSLFQKVILTTLTPEQQETYHAELLRVRLRRRKAITRSNIVQLEKSMPLTSTQRQKLVKLLDAQELPENMHTHMEGYAGFLKLASAKDKDLSEFLDKQQMEVIHQHQQRYRGWINVVR